MKKSIWRVALATLGLAVAAQGRMEGRGGGGPGDGPRWGGGEGLQMLLRQESRLRDLGATEEQVEKLKTLAYTLRKDMIALQAEREQGRLELDRLLDAASLDKKALETIVEQLGAVDARMLKNRIETRVQIREILGNELLRTLRDEAQKHLREMRRGKGEESPRGWRKGPGRGRPHHEPEVRALEE